MYTLGHFVLSLAVSAALVVLLEPSRPAVFVLVGVCLGTLIDLDHFAIARLKTGTWAPLRRALSNPRVAVLDQEEIFDPGDVGALERLLSHAALGGVVVGVLLVASVPLAVLAAVVLYVHVLADLVADVRRYALGGHPLE